MHLRSCAARLRQRTLLAVLTALVPVGVLHAGAVLYVDDDAAPNGNGESWDTAYRFLSDALGAAAESDAGVNQIRIAQGIYLPDRSEATPGGSGSRSATFELIDGLELRGGYAGIGAADPDERDITLYESVLSGDLLQDDEFHQSGTFWWAWWLLHTDENSHHVVTAINTTPAPTLDGLTIHGGNANGPDDVRGGGVVLVDGALNVANCVFRWNQARYAQTIHARGGAIWAASSTLSVEQSLFTENQAAGGTVGGATPPGGGALAASASVVTLTACDFEHNWIHDGSGAKGGALWAATGTEIEMNACSFIRNVASANGGFGMGGAALISSATLNAVNCVFQWNLAEGGNEASGYGGSSGGAFSTWNSAVTFETCRLVDNGVYSEGGFAKGGAIESDDSTLRFTDCVIAGNIGDNYKGGDSGAALYLRDTPTTMINTTVAHNGGEEASSIITLMGSENITVMNSVLWGNCVVWGCDIFEAPVSQVQIDYSCVEGGSGGYGGAGNHSLDPLFVDPVGPDGFSFSGHDNDYRLLSGSPCVDAGDNSATDSDTDLDGNDRFVDDPDTEDTGIGTPPIIDMGPYELQLDLCPMDLDDNGAVDFQDLLVMLGAWNNPYSFVDLIELLAAWGDCP